MSEKTPERADASMMASWIAGGDVDSVKECLPKIASLLDLATADSGSTQARDYEIVCQWIDANSSGSEPAPVPQGDPATGETLRGAAHDAAVRLAESCMRA